MSLESSAMFSPDGRWIAYLPNEGGRNDVFVQPYPGPGGKYQISTTAGGRSHLVAIGAGVVFFF